MPLRHGKRYTLHEDSAVIMSAPTYSHLFIWKSMSNSCVYINNTIILKRYCLGVKHYIEHEKVFHNISNHQEESRVS